MAKEADNPLGRIAILKSLILSELLHLWLLLPEPPETFIEDLLKKINKKNSLCMEQKA